MERLLRDSLAAEVTPCDLDAPLLLYPVRHHSPVCAWQLTRLMEKYAPDIVLIEGPVDANPLLPVLTAPDTKLPAAFYCFYKDSRKLISEEGGDYKCYYPFLYASPEYNAAVQAKQRGIPAQFIDLPFSELLIQTAKYGSPDEQSAYADDRRLVRSRFFQKLCEKTGTRSFDEFWEKYFEIGGAQLEPEEYVRLMHTYCALSRADVPEDTLLADGTLVREQFMAKQIADAMQQYPKVLAVTGGFHSPGLQRLIESGSIKPPRIHSIPAAQQGCYPMAYAYEAADALSGYASGMRYPAFCDAVMQQLCETGAAVDAYNTVTLDLLVRTAKACTKQDIAVSIADVTAAHSMMTGLAALRNSRACGMTELSDAVRACMIKGETTVSSALPLDILNKLAVGKGIGHIGDKTHVPPLVSDFEKQCKALKLNDSRTLTSNAEAALFTSKKGMELSRFMHRMTFLNTGFCKKLKGPDLHKRRDRSRVREEWKYRRSPNVDAALIDHTTDGFTIAEACAVCAERLLKTQPRCETAAHVAVDCLLMGIPLSEAGKRMTEDILNSDGDIFSIGSGLQYFEMLHDLGALYETQDETPLQYVTRCFERLVMSLPAMAAVPPERANDCIGILRTMYGLTVHVLPDRQTVFQEMLEAMSGAQDKEPALYGAVLGFLCAADPAYRERAELAMRGYLRGSPDIRKMGAEYLRGLFSAARDIVLTDDSFLRMTDTLIRDMDAEDFMEILPSLRLAFSYFTPSEIQTAAETVAAIYGTGKDDILKTAAVDEELYRFAQTIDRTVRSII